MNGVAEYDMTGLNDFVSGLTGAFFGESGEGGDGSKVLMVETGQLGGRIGDALGPKTKAAANKRIQADVKQQLSILPRYAVETQEGVKYADFTWLAHGGGFVMGINDEDNQVSATGAEALAMFRAGQRAGSRGKTIIGLGQRGHQSVLRLNRIRVSKSAMNYVALSIAEKTGELRAAFYRVAIQFTRKRVPQWILQKVDQTIASGKSTLNDDQAGAGAEAFIEFGVRAPGVTGNAAITVKIQGAVERSKVMLAEKFRKVLAGYKYDWETGRVFRPRIQSLEDEA